jgi:6-phosphogluconolactonase (cycloisomerase 2 family)
MTSGDDVLYIGGYTAGTGGSGTGLTVVRREAGGALKAVAETAAPGPSFLAFHPRLPVVYAVLECEEGGVAAYSAYSPDSGGPALLADGASGGSYPCHAAVDPSGTWLSVANYGDGTVAIFRLGDSGLFAGLPRLFPGHGHGRDPARQAGPHAHQSTFGPDLALYVTDLGTDQVRRFTMGAEPTIHPGGPVAVPPGSGPRHLARHDGRWYVGGELDGTIRVYDAGWRECAVVRASETTGPNLISHVEISPDGRHLYAANRGPDTVAVFGLDDAGGLTRVAEVGSGGLWPRHFTVAGGHLYVANQRSDNVVVFALRDGVPVRTGLAFEVGSPSCVLPAPA